VRPVATPRVRSSFKQVSVQHCCCRSKSPLVSRSSTSLGLRLSPEVLARKRWASKQGWKFSSASIFSRSAASVMLAGKKPFSTQASRLRSAVPTIAGSCGRSSRTGDGRHKYIFSCDRQYQRSLVAVGDLPWPSLSTCAVLADYLDRESRLQRQVGAVFAFQLAERF
jgi:hypothetical protein